MTPDWIVHGLGELRSVRSLRDLMIVGGKTAHILPRMILPLAGRAKLPGSLQIEPTNHCNLNCTCCSLSRSQRARGYMNLGLFQKIVDDASQVGVRLVHMYLHGEPMLHPQIVEMIRCVKSKGLAVRLTTNGMLFNRSTTEAILRSGVDRTDHIVFSVLGHSRAVHEGIMRGVDHDTVLENIHGVLALRKDLGMNGPVVEVVFYTMPENEHEKERYYNHWRGVVDHVHVVKTISKQFSEFGGETQAAVPVRTNTCVNLWERMAVFWDGDVTTCIADQDGMYRLGNLGEQSIKDIWNGEVLSSIRRLHKEKKFASLPLCSRCDW